MMMDERGKSDRFVVCANSPNDTAEPASEVREGRERTKGNPPERHAVRTQSRATAAGALERMRQPARRDRTQRFTALLHHVYDVELAHGVLRDTAGRGGGHRRRNVATRRR
jgi:RNA-directed DNA polymerase